MNSLVIPVYGNAGSIPELLGELRELAASLEGGLEVVFVVDGSPDDCFSLLREALPTQPFASQLVAHSRNFGSFAAIRTGMKVARGTNFAVMAADLQEPTSLARRSFELLARGEADIAIGVREGRSDGPISSLFSALFWGMYRRAINPSIPKGGVDVFACTQRVRDELDRLEESNTSLVALLFWIGFRRAFIGYTRLPRRHGKSGWSFSRKLRYMVDSIYAFSDLPIRLLSNFGALAVFLSILFAIVVFIARLTGNIPVPGYTVTVLAIAFFGGLNAFGLGVIGGYVWRAYENTKRRPSALVMSSERFEPSDRA